jgi:hypothetical protein
VTRLPDTVREALGNWWTLAMSAGYGGYTTTDTVSAAGDLAGQFGRSLTFSESSAIATLFGYARRMSNAADQVQAAFRDTVIGPEHIAVPPWARDEAEMATLPIWHVHFDLTYTDANGVIQTERKVATYRMTFFDTFGELQDALDADAEAMASKYDGEFISADVKEIHAV